MATKETSSLKQTCPGCGSLVDTSDAEPLARVSCPNCGEKVRAERAFDHFILLESIGVGGMGTVYKARDALLDRLVALKLLRKDLGEGIDHAARLQHEARVAASINHPNVVQVFSSGTDHGQFYLVMELVDRGSLDDFIEQQKRLPEELVLEAGIQVAQGLRAAEAKGLIHRDVKPANILFADEHTAKIGDFGLAGAAAEDAETRGEIWGTPYYVAPERLNNEQEDFRSDIYSLGATLFHAVAGRAPIEGETNSAVTLRELKSNPVDVATVAPDVSGPTAAVLNRMIAPDRNDRFASYDELVSDLQNAYGLLTGKEEFLAQRKSKIPWIIGTAVLLIALIGVGAWAFISRNRDRSALNAVSARAEQLAVAPLETQAAQARKELVQNHYKVAGAAFARIATDAKKRQPLYDWARLQQALAAMVGREMAQAREPLQEVQRTADTGFAHADLDLAKFFTETAGTLLSSATIPARLANKPTPPYFPFASLLYGVKDLEQADVADAVGWLEEFVAAKPSPQFGWFAELKPLAQKYLDEGRLYLAWQTQSKSSGADVSVKLAQLRDLRKKIRARSPIADRLNAEEKELSGQMGQQGRKGIASPMQQPRATATTAPTLWAGALTVYKQKVAAYDFAGARDIVAQFKPADAASNRGQAAAQKKSQWLIAWKQKLIDDINRSPFAVSFSGTTGEQYTGIERANDQSLVLKIPYGVAEVPWAKIPPATLLKISTLFTKPGQPDTADRNWLNAVFAAETGQAEPARSLAEAAAQQKPQYRSEIQLLRP